MFVVIHVSIFLNHHEKGWNVEWVSYLDISMDNIEGVAIFDCINDRSDSFSCLLLTV